MANLEQLRHQVWEANLGIYRAGLVTMHSGNASGVDRNRGLVLIKPSGMDYDKMKAADLVGVDLEGRKVRGKWKPSVDLPHHLYLYRHRPDICAVVHTHSNFATSFAALGRAIPAYLTAIADEFGDEIPCAPYVDNIGDHIGEAIIAAAGRSPAVLLANHGIFAFGATVAAAFKAAVMVEDVARTCHLALQLGSPKPLPPEEVKKWYERYHSTYGQTETPAGASRRTSHARAGRG
jgi:L-ribulose-5-phosphate 4-epimerase